MIKTPDAIRRRPRPPRVGPFARYSRFVGIMKVVLPALAVVLLALLALWPALTLDDTGFQIGFVNLPSKEVESLAMRNARFFGTDRSNRPYAVSADLATQDPGNNQITHLQAPKADFTTSVGANVVVVAESGVYHHATNLLDLSGGVSLYHDSGTEMHTATATVDLTRSSARGVDPVTGHGPQGQIDSIGFELTEKGQGLIFTGKSRMILRGATVKPASARKTGATSR